ncbi:hypothetical protein CEE45_02210 [Candidatus Heimdallarchaeota archaeon B3_Heim]|nr:MAG: hypothetical protein CEE45_02210 [Candidatus Heimdallarchaeota archaeon B3_Heim]
MQFYYLFLCKNSIYNLFNLCGTILSSITFLVVGVGIFIPSTIFEPKFAFGEIIKRSSSILSIVGDENSSKKGLAISFYFYIIFHDKLFLCYCF